MSMSKLTALGKVIVFVASVWLSIAMGALSYAFESTFENDQSLQQFQIPAATVERVQHQYGVDAKKRVLGWQALVQKEQKAASPALRKKLQRANDYFNQVEWLTDIEHWGQEDYWASPIETLATNAGDCEDFSIAKYFSLLNSNVENERLRITYVKSLSFNQAHMVLAYYESPGAEPLILDNINKTILPASQRDDLLPVYSFNAQDIWLARNSEKKLKGSSQKSLPQWQAVHLKIRKELGVE
jgi:predicted transglutaminase-like cysteine proteinase